MVYPPISIMADVEIPAGSMVGTFRAHQSEPTRSRRTQVDFGSSSPAIHSSASTGSPARRRDQLLVKEFDLEPTANLWIALDLDRSVQAGHGDESTEEYGVKIVSSLAHQFRA